MLLKDPEELKKLKLADLKKLCTELDLPTNGTKADLLDRISCHEDSTFGTNEKAIVTLQPDDEAELLDNVSDVVDTDLGNPLDVEAIELEMGVDESVGGTKRKRDADESLEEEISAKKPATVDEVDVPEVPVLTSKLSQEERIALRARRFGTNASDTPRPPGHDLKEEKLLERARRFGLPVTAGGVPAEKLKSRADRFGEITSPILSLEEQEKRKTKRLEKFGTVEVADDEDLEKRKLARANRFGEPVAPSPVAGSPSTDSEKLSKRAARFGITPVSGPA